MTPELETLLKNVFSVDTEAGYKLRYHITRALACKKYARAIAFNSTPEYYELADVFIWSLTHEGAAYWVDIESLLETI